MSVGIRARGLPGLLLIGLLAACASSDSTGPYGGNTGGNTAGNTGNNTGGSGGTGGNTDTAPNTVVIANASFSPETLTVKMGTAVTFQNNDAVIHTATADSGAFDTGDIDGGTTAQRVLEVVGTFAYHCQIHSYMHGVIKVQ